MTNFLPVVAEASASGGNQSSMIFMILFYVAIFAALYFFLTVPEMPEIRAFPGKAGRNDSGSERISQ